MTSRDGHGALPFSVRLAAWACVALWLPLLPLVDGLAVSAVSTDHAPRAVLVSLAHENDLHPILSSIHQLEDTFNSRYRYDWVFYSTKPLSDKFRRLTSNATNATCIYEVIRDANWNVPEWARDSPLQVHQTDDAHGAEADVVGYGSDEAAPLLRQIHRWKSGPFARENRLKDYDWFGRIEPGTQFTHDIDFDVFRVMRDYGIAYGSNKAAVDEAHIHALSQHVKGFIDKNPELLHAEADISWLMGSSGDGPVAADDFGLEGGDETAEEQVLEPARRIVSAGGRGMTGSSAAAGLQDETGDEDEAGSPAEAFASWLGGIFKSSLSPQFEIGSLAFFRSQSHQALFEHLDKTGDFYYRGPRDMSTPTLSASMFLPQKSVLHFRKRAENAYARGPSPPDSTPKPQLKLVGIARDFHAGMLAMESAKRTRQPGPQQLSEVMAEMLAWWELLSGDVERQGGIPGLISGNTVIDDRNFVFGLSKLKPVAVG
ncbi:putative mannosyltransferase KTR3 [Tolypocladium ophioglossoides CBS 100239]|uniref:Putative mannosyltransferase KTR3 n=1 Tax=Tolypocladium ophioglossoides (strain CBS 100239) TaxID=1163406 RepID=A0A0L0NEH9_TOLOC|nr:putative mannosyltransferase KTR3 [Tolypocladium ophioglossoides CBS 100239]